jgi:YD repeat-containing protein
VRTSPADANGWILYEKQVTMAATTTLTLSGTSTAFIDELRVYPTAAQMTTYTYDRLFGVTSVTDPANFTTYYEYDSFGRLKFVKDKDGNIQTVSQYNYKFK